MSNKRLKRFEGYPHEIMNGIEYNGDYVETDEVAVSFPGRKENEFIVRSGSENNEKLREEDDLRKLRDDSIANDSFYMAAEDIVKAEMNDLMNEGIDPILGSGEVAANGGARRKKKYNFGGFKPMDFMSGVSSIFGGGQQFQGLNNLQNTSGGGIGDLEAGMGGNQGITPFQPTEDPNLANPAKYANASVMPTEGDSVAGIGDMATNVASKMGPIGGMVAGAMDISHKIGGGIYEATGSRVAQGFLDPFGAIGGAINDKKVERAEIMGEQKVAETVRANRNTANYVHKDRADDAAAYADGGVKKLYNTGGGKGMDYASSIIGGVAQIAPTIGFLAGEGSDYDKVEYPHLDLKTLRGDQAIADAKAPFGSTREVMRQQGRLGLGEMALLASQEGKAVAGVREGLENANTSIINQERTHNLGLDIQAMNDEAANKGQYITNKYTALQQMGKDTASMMNEGNKIDNDKRIEMIWEEVFGNKA